MRARSFAIVFSLGALGACSVSEKHPSGNIDGGDTDAMTDAPIDANVDVSGTSMLTHYVRNGNSVATMMAPEDLSIYTFAAYVPDTNEPTGFRIINGMGNAQGQLTIPNVPMGPYYLRVLVSGASAPTFYYTDDRALDLGFGTAGKPGLPDVALPSPINPTITGIDRTWDTDYFTLHSLGTGTEHYPITFSSALPLGVRPSLTTSFEWTGGYGWALPRMRPKLLQNDDVEILHQHSSSTSLPVENKSIDQLAEIARMTGLTQTDGSPLAVSGAFVDVPLNQMVTINFDMSALRQAYGNAPHVNETVSGGLGVLLGTDPNNRFGPGLVSLFVSSVKAPTTTIGQMVSYGNPYDNTWALVATESYLRRRRVRLPGVAANQPANNISFNMSATRSYTGGPVGPTVQVGPPTNLRVGGTTATDGVRTFDGMAPITVQWTAVTNANRYRVSALRLIPQSGFSANPSTVATIITTETSAMFPAALFATGERYVFSVSSIRDGLQYANGRLRAEVVPGFSTSNVTGVILLSNTCGNGTREGAEECDTSGQSATCDIDCSLPVCFDGILNSAANEQCDPGIGTGTCDTDCTLAMCGDARLNFFAGEQCDDGNQNDSDGCNHLCQYENSCGDAITQPIYGEDCDDQNAVNTDACINCKAAQCGDGFVQAGVEQCDDGNLINGDGCSDACMTD